MNNPWSTPVMSVTLLPARAVLPDGTVVDVPFTADTTYEPRPCELDDDPLEWHVVKVDQRTIVCADGCDGPEPHMNEYRATV
jgi:hypothetical protein